MKITITSDALITLQDVLNGTDIEDGRMVVDAIISACDRMNAERAAAGIESSHTVSVSDVYSAYEILQAAKKVSV